MIPLSWVAYKYSATTMVIFWFQPIVWTLNVKPVQAFLRQNSGDEDKRTLWSWMLPENIGGINHNIRVACSASERKKSNTRGQSQFSYLHESPLAIIMGFGPLEEAFGEFCRKALCSEVSNVRVCM